MGLAVIGSGLSRTGTMSLKAALETLGFKPCYHASENVKRLSHIRCFYELACHGKPLDWHRIFKNFRATVDAPTCFYYKELLEAFPEARVVHTVREPDSWYDSSYTTIYHMADVVPGWLRKCSRSFRKVIDLMNSYWVGFFDGRFEDRAYAIDKFNQYNAEVVQSVPADRPLVFEVKQGWGSLCAFLGVPVPDVPFPHVNDHKTLVRQMRWLGHIYRGLPVIGVVLVLAVIFFVYF